MKLFNDPNYPKGSLENPQSALGLRAALAFFGFVMFAAFTILTMNTNWRWLFLVMTIVAAYNAQVVITKWSAERMRNKSDD